MSAPAIAHVPRYIEVRESIRSRIERGVYTPESRIPTEAEFERELGVSRITVTNALEDPVQDGLPVRQRGRDTFIRKPAKRPVATGN